MCSLDGDPSKLFQAIARGKAHFVFLFSYFFVFLFPSKTKLRLCESIAQLWLDFIEENKVSAVRSLIALSDLTLCSRSQHARIENFPFSFFKKLCNCFLDTSSRYRISSIYLFIWPIYVCDGYMHIYVNMYTTPHII